MSFEIPAGLTDLLQDFTVAVLREKPDSSDLVNFAANYFDNLCSNKNFSNVTHHRYNDQLSRGEPQHESMQTESDSDEEPFEPPQIERLTRRKSVSAEGYDPEADDEEADDRVIHPKSDEQRRRLSEAVMEILLFRSLDTEQMQEVLDAMFEKKVEPGEHVIDQGDDGDNFYVIDSGTYDIFVVVNNADKHVGNYENQGSFGELALMYNMPRAATIIATSAGTLWAMDRSTFRRIVLKNAFNKRKMYESLLENVPMLKDLDTYERMNVADALVPEPFTDGQCIIKQGEEADCMYFIETGEVRIMMSQKDVEGSDTSDVKQQDSDKEVDVTVCKKGQYFGELALVTHKPRAASAYALGPTKCAVLDVKAFERLLGPCMDILRRNIEDYEEQLVQIFGSKADMSDLR